MMLALQRLPKLRWPPTLTILLAVLAAVIAAQLLTPSIPAGAPAPNLETTIPKRFGAWTSVDDAGAQVSTTVAAEGENTIDRPYDQVVSRAYSDGHGTSVMVAIAWGAAQRQEVKIHRPPACYGAQGFDVLSVQPVRFDAVAGSSSPVAGRRMLARAPGRLEAASYWIRVGSLYSDEVVATRMNILADGLRGQLSDGVLVRASQIVDPQATPAQIEHLYRVQEAFLAELVAATPGSSRSLLIR